MLVLPYMPERFAAAELDATTARDWYELARFVRASGDDPRRYLDRARALVGTDLVAARNVATGYAAIADRETAVRVLGDVAGALLDDPATDAVAWRLFAAAWLEHGERDAALHYLEHARATASGVGELCEVACGYYDAHDLDRTLELLERAAREARTLADWGRLANTWRFALEDEPASHALIAGAGSAARSIDELVPLAALHYRLFGDDAPETDPLERGDDLARTAEDWLALGLAWWDGRYDGNRAEPCLARAAALATDELLHAHITREIQRVQNFVPAGQGEDGARQLAPEELVLPRDEHGWRADPRRLFAWLCARLTDEQLRSIAANDYGWRADESLQVLEGIRDRLLIPTAMYGYTRENFELERWSSGHATDHVARAFACAMLCLIGPGYTGGESESMSALVESCIVLGGEAIDAMVALFAAMEDDVFILLGLILGVAAIDPSDPRLRAQITRLRVLEGRPNPYGDKSSGFLWRTSNFDQRYDLWRSLARALLDTPNLRELAELLGVT